MAVQWLTFRQVPDALREEWGDLTPSFRTVQDWAYKGLRGVRLRTERKGGRRVTCRAWLEEFFRAVETAPCQRLLVASQAAPVRARAAQARIAAKHGAKRSTQ